MKKLTLVVAVLAVTLFAVNASAQEVSVGTDAPGSYKKFVVGGYMGLGMATFVGDVDDAKMRFAGEGEAYFDFYLMPILALEAGLGFVGTGYRLLDKDFDPDLKVRYSLINMEIPLGAKLNIHNFQISLMMVMYFILSGKIKSEAGSNESEHKLNDDDWDNVRRFNIGPKITFGYAIPIGPVSLVPGVSWMMYLINVGKDLPGPMEDDQYRAMNIMFNIGAEFGF